MTSTTMHLVIYAYITNGLNIMKFVNNHPQDFNLPAFCYLMGAFQVLICLHMEFMNILILYSKTDESEVVECYVTQLAVISMSGLYFAEVVNTDRALILRNILDEENAPLIQWINKEHSFWERNWI